MGESMRVEIDIPRYGESLAAAWEPGFEIETRVEDGEIVVRANAAGLRSLARLLLSLAGDDVPAGRHLHRDDATASETGSVPAIIERT